MIYFRLPQGKRQVMIQKLSVTPLSKQLLHQGDFTLFIGLWILLVVLAGTLAGCTPLWFSVTIALIFGAPHNWVELRYFISRLPSNFGPCRAFFITAFTGALTIATTQAFVMFAIHKLPLSLEQAKGILLIWNECIILWTLALFFTRYQKIDRSAFILGPTVALATTLANILSPSMFTAAIAYAHPIIGICIMEREIRRTRKSWLKPFHKCLLAVPLAVGLLYLTLQGVASDKIYSETLVKVSGNTAYHLLPEISPAVLLAGYAFLQMIHYGLWIFIMPLVTKSWRRWKTENLPIARDRKQLRPFINLALFVGVLAIVGFWTGFYFNRSTTMEIYVTISALHIVAELPLLFWLYES